MATIVTKNSSTASAVPTTSDLVQGELAVNVTDKRIFTENASTQIVELGTNPSTVTTATATVTGTLTANGTFASSNAVITGGSINSTPIGATTPSTIVGSTVTANTGFVGGLTGNVTGNLTGNVTGNVNGNLTGNVTGNVTASSGTTTLNDLVVNGTADFTNTKLTNITTPTVGTDAANKSYVDDTVAAVIDSAPAALDTLNELAAALGDDANFAGTVTTALATKLPLAGGTMTGAIAMGTSKITGLGNPTSAQDAATKTYVDTADALKLNLTGGTMSGAIAMGTNKITGVGNPTLAQDAATKDYVDDILGSATSAATSAAAAATSASNAATSASNAASSATASANSASAAAASYDAFDDRYLGDKASDPTLDNDGNALLTGALYFNTTSDVMKVYDGSAWNIAAISSASPTFTGTVTADGLNINGTATMDGLTVDGNATLSSTGSVTLTLAADTDNITETDVPTIIMSQDNNLTNVYFGIEGIADTAFSGSVANYPYIKSTSALQIATSSSPTALFEYNGDISFYEDTGTTPKFFWDASAEALGIGTSSVGTYALAVDSGTKGVSDSEAGIYSKATRNGVTWNLVVNNTFTSTNTGTGIKFTNGDFDTGGIIVRADGAASSGDSAGYMTFHTSTNGSEDLTERMRIDSSGNVGIGTSSPVTALEISTDGTDQLTLNRADASISTNNTLAGIVVSADDPTANRSGAKIGFTAGDNWTTNYFPTNIIFSNDAAGTMTERMRIASSGNVGIGELNPFGLLHLKGDTNANGAELYLQVNNNNTTDNLGAINFGNNVDLTLSKILSGTSGASNSSYLTFSTSSSGSESERMRIDSSGNLLVGRTTDANTNGLSLLSSGFFRASTTSTTTGVFNRNTSDGAILGFSKDGTTVGLIATLTGALQISGNTKSGLQFNDSSFIPLQNGATIDATIDLGSSARRFKDLYLSGTAKVANVLETVYALSGTALDAGNGGIQTKTLAASTTFTDSLASGESIVLQLEAGASYTVTWPTMTWVTSGGNTAPTLTAKDTLVFWKVSSTLYGAYTGSYV
jgi:hypothetical protein